MSAFPKWRARLEIVHKKIRRREGFGPMSGGGGDKNDAFARFDQSMAMDDREAQKRPTRGGLGGDARDLGFRHPGVMFDLQRPERSAFVSAEPDETHQSADIPSPAA